ncbi:MAG: 3-deoxy-manno-octulosonate cytidylyltransferase [Pseudomonadota bacterium]
MNIVAIIPCRYGSKRFEGKPLMPILGKPMIWWVYSRARKADILTDVVVATDDDKIYKCVKDFGGHVLMTQPGHRSGTDRAAEAACALNLDGNDIVINIQGDQPAFDPRCLAEVVNPLLESQQEEMSTLIYKISQKAEISNSNHVKATFDHNNYALYFSRSTIPYNRDNIVGVEYFKHLGIYAYRKHFLDTFCSLPEGRLEQTEKLEQLRALEFGHRIKLVETLYDSPEVDTPQDIPLLESTSVFSLNT